MRPRLLIVAACLLAVLALAACGSDERDAPAAKPFKDPGLFAGTTLKRGGLKLPARIQGQDLALAYEGKAGWPVVQRSRAAAR